MARNKKKKNRKSRSVTDANLPAVAQSYLSKGQFAEAIKAFRRLYENDGSRQMDVLFKQSFLGRISQLSAKGMHTEALVIYGNMLLVFPAPDTTLHVSLLTAAGKFQEAVEMTDREGATLTKNDKTTIDEIFAAQLLGGQMQLKDVLSEESSVCLHYSAAEHALQAYCKQVDGEVHTALREIPFRSPYKNFVLALKGMLAFDKDRTDSLRFFEKISQDSPFSSLAVPYRHLAEVDYRQRNKPAGIYLKVVNSLEGTDAKTARLLDNLNSLNITGMRPATLYQTLVRHGICLGRKQLRKICFRILPHAPGQAGDFQKRFGQFSKYDLIKLEALSVELDDSYYIEDAWKEFCDLLIADECVCPDKKLQIALVYRHIAEHMEKDSYEYNSKDIEAMLKKSIPYDPLDKETWMKLVNLRHLSPAKRYKYINTMLETFPEDIGVMTLGVEAAIKRSAFKKASRLAAKLLAVDPINTKIRTMLIDAHLAHAGKMAKQQKYEIALRECELAASFERQNLSQGKIQIYQGLLIMLTGGEAAGLKMLEEGADKAVNPLLAHFVIRLEAGLLNMVPRLLNHFTTQLKKTVKKPVEKDVILQLFDNISRCSGEKQEELEKFRAIFTPCLKRAARLVYSMDESKRICQILHLRHYHDLLLLYAKAALKRHTENPLFLFYQIYAQTNGGKKRLNNRQIDALDTAWHEAMDMDDEATAHLIGVFLDENVSFMGSPMGMGGSPKELIKKMFGGAILEKFVRGVEPTEEEMDSLVEEILDSGFPDEEPESPVKKKSNPKQLSLFT